MPVTPFLSGPPSEAAWKAGLRRGALRRRGPGRGWFPATSWYRFDREHRVEQQAGPDRPRTGAATELASAGFPLNPIGVDVDLDGFAFVKRRQPAGGPDRARRGLAGARAGLISALPNVRGIVLDPGGDAFVSSPTTDEIIRVDTVTGTSAPASAHGLIHPTGLVRDPNGDLVVADSGAGGSRILRVDPQNGSQTQLAGDPPPPGPVPAPQVPARFEVLRDIEIDPAADCNTPQACSYLVIDSGARKVFRVDAAIAYDPAHPDANISDWAACAGFQSPRGIAVDGNGDVLVSDFAARKVFKINKTSLVCSE
jgi:hypothetical protein